MALDGVLDRFVQVAEREYSLKFPILQGAGIYAIRLQVYLFSHCLRY